MLNVEAAALALPIERVVGYPNALHRLIGHPVEWMGKLISWLDELLNYSTATPRQSRLRGAIALALLIAATALPAWIAARLLSGWSLGWIVEALLATSLIAQKSLRDHVRAVADGLGRSLEEGRLAVSRIVGRDPHGLDQSGVARAALESLAENASDGVVAPVLWYAVLGLPGLVFYKAVNTADSMIGHRTERYRHFGWASARLDDLINLPASRVTGLLFAVAAERFGSAWRAMRRDAPLHVSPNAGWPEAALATALGIRLGGPRAYGGQAVGLAWMGDGREALEADDIRRGLSLYDRALTVLFLAVLALAIVA